MHKANVTREYGLLEKFLAKQRIKLANKLIPSSLRNGRILDIGCGTYPLFLLSTDFAEKYGLEKIENKNILHDKVSLINFDLEKQDVLPFDNEYFDIVTMLAVFEHIQSTQLVDVMKEVHRILKHNGIYIMTTPSVWTDNLLRCMAKLRLVSPAEIEEHKDTYSQSRVSSILQKAGFSKEKMRLGYFEIYMNTWAAAVK